MSTQSEPKPLKVWVKGENKPLPYKTSVEAMKDVKNLQNATSASIEIVEKITTEGSTISSKDAAGLRNWAIKELDALTKVNKNLTFLDVKYIPKEVVVDKQSGVVNEYPAKLVFRRSVSRDND